MTDFAQQIAEMQDELSYLRHDIETTKRSLAVVTADRDRLLIENSMIASRARASQDKATRVETILSQVSMGLVAGLQEIRSERDDERAQRRETQAQTFAQETREDPPPAFLRRPGPPERMMIGTESAPPLRRAPTTTELKRPLDARIDTTLASRDSRLPGGPEWGRPEPEEGSLENMAQRATGAR